MTFTPAEVSSATHFTRNNFVLRALELGADLRNIASGSLPTSLVRDFLHEVTHHWCFTSPVGYVVSALHLHAQLTRLVNNEYTPQDVKALLSEDEARVRLVRTALDPIAEGLALFAELDLKVGEHTTPPMFPWLAALFLRTELSSAPMAGFPGTTVIGLSSITQSAADEAISLILERERATPECQGVRENLLSQPFALEAKGHYLLGYVFMKRIERQLRNAFGTLAEPGLILEWVARFVFWDAQLVLLLFGEQRAKNYHDILAHFEARLDLMFSDRALDWFKGFANERAGRTPQSIKIGTDESTPAWMLGLKDEEVLASGEVEQKTAKRLLDIPGLDTPYKFFAVRALTMRHVTALGQIAGETEVWPDGWTHFSHPRGFCLQQGREGITPGKASGVLTYFFSSAFSTSCGLLTRGAEAVSISGIKSPSVEMEDYLLSPLLDFPQYDKALRELDAWYQAAFNVKIGAPILLEVERIYQSVALGDVPLTRRADLISRMRESGFFSLLEADLDRLKDLVALGLPGGERLLPVRVAELAAAGEAAGLPLVEEFRGRSISRF